MTERLEILKKQLSCMTIKQEKKTCKTQKSVKEYGKAQST